MKLVSVILMLIVSSAVCAFPIGYQTLEIYENFLSVESSITTNSANIATNTADINTIESTLPEKIHYEVYDLNVTATLAAAATVTYPLQKLPANAVVVNSFYEVQTQVVSANDNTVAFACGSTTIDTAADLTDVVANTIAAADITATASTYKNVGAECTPTFTIGAGASGVTAGRVRWYVAYVTR